MDLKRQQRCLDTLVDVDRPLEPGGTVLDFGCGAGHGVSGFRQLGYRAFGADISLAVEVAGLEDPDGDVFRLIEMETYRVPFPADTFDFVYSEGVFEHVNNYGEAFSEIHRVLKPGGTSIHLFPARWRVIEGHVFVPFAGAIRNRPWLLVWALLGVRNQYQKGKSARDVAAGNERYLREDCTYYTAAEIRRLASEVFGDEVSFVELPVAKNQFRARRHIYPLMRALPVLVPLVRHFHMRALMVEKRA